MCLQSARNSRERPETVFIWFLISRDRCSYRCSSVPLLVVSVCLRDTSGTGHFARVLPARVQVSDPNKPPRAAHTRSAHTAQQHNTAQIRAPFSSKKNAEYYVENVVQSEDFSKIKSFKRPWSHKTSQNAQNLSSELVKVFVELLKCAIKLVRMPLHHKTAVRRREMTPRGGHLAGT